MGTAGYRVATCHPAPLSHSLDQTLSKVRLTMSHIFRLFGVLLIGLASFSIAPAASAQTALQPEAVEQLVTTAKDNGLQVIVIGPAETTSDADQQEDALGSSMVMRSQQRIESFRNTLRNRLRAGNNLLGDMVAVMNSKAPTGHYVDFVIIAAVTFVLLTISQYLVRISIGRHVFGPWFIPMQKPNPVGYTEKLPILLFRTLLEIIGMIAVITISYILGLIVGQFFSRFNNLPPSQAEVVSVTVGYLYFTYFAARSVVFLWRMILAPFLEQYRIPYFSDRDAKRLFSWLWVVATIAVIVLNFLSWIEELGLSYNHIAMLSSVATLFVVILNVAMVLANRRAISTAILNGQTPEQASVPARLFARLWAPFVIVYFFVAWAEMTYRLIEALPLGTPLITGFYEVLLAVIVVYGLVAYVIERMFHRRRMIEEMAAHQAVSEAAEEGWETEEPEYRPVPKIRTFEDLTRRMAAMLALFAGIFALGAIWQVDIEMVSPIVEARRDMILDVTIVLFIGYFVYHFVRIWIDQKIEEEGGGDVEVAPGDEGGAGGASRLATLLPLFRNALLVTIFIAVGLIALTELGFNVAPLFAGAGVVGLAIGFGAQSLVRDIFSGAFFLIDDAFRKGEYIDVGTVKGTVEKISPRSFQLRHHLGPLHTIPFGEIQTLTNFSRDWVMMKLPLRVTYDTDPEKVRKLVKKLGQDLAADPLIGDQFLQPLKSQGVIEMQDSAMIIRVKFMTKPGDQWVLRKRVFAEIRDLFAREGIKFAHREVTVRIADGEGENLTPKQKEALGSAVLAMEDQDLEDAMGGDGDDR